MVTKLSKIVLLGAVLLTWIGFMLYLLAHMENVGTYRVKIRTGAHWVEELVSNFSKTDSLDSVKTPPNPRKAQDLLQIAIQAKEDDLGGLITLVNSVISNTKHEVYFYFIIPQKSFPHLQQWMKVPELSNLKYSYAHPSEELSEYSYTAKFSIAKLFPDLRGRVIFLEPDVIVQGDIFELNEIELQSDSLGAFSSDCYQGSGGKLIASRGETRYANRINLKHPSISSSNISPLACTFNTGVFVMGDVDVWTKEDVPQKVEQLLKDHKEESIVGPHVETDVVEAALLVVLYKRTSPLDPLWHVRHLGTSRRSSYSPYFLASAKLLHWSGHFKPWSSKGSASEQRIWLKHFIRDPLGLFSPIRAKNSDM